MPTNITEVKETTHTLNKKFVLLFNRWQTMRRYSTQMYICIFDMASSFFIQCYGRILMALQNGNSVNDESYLDLN